MKKKLRIKKEPAIKLAVVLVLLIISLTFGIKYYNGRYIRKLKSIGYSTTEINAFKHYKVDIKTLTKYDYNPVIATIVDTTDYKDENLKKYLDMYQEGRDISLILYIVNNNISYDYSDKLVNIIKSDYFMLDRLDRYMNYSKQEDPRLIVRDVNSNVDYDYYTNTTKTNYFKGNLILVNKYYYLDSDYECNDLVKVENKYANLDGNMLNKEAYEALKDLITIAETEGYHIRINYSYRDYNRQESIYNNYVKTKGKEYADSISARPGFSEHQTGYSVDVGVQSKYSTGSFKNSKEYSWMKENSYKFGFILRYPEGLEKVTGYSAEAWHYRYVGLEAAKYIYEHNITFDEYYAYFIENK